MTQIWPQRPPPTQREQDLLFLLLMEDNPPHTPPTWMGDLKFWALSGFAHILRGHARDRGLGWYVTALLPILIRLPTREAPYRLVPDAFVAFAPDRPRPAFDVAKEDGFPPFALDVASPDDENGKIDDHLVYDLLDAREYLSFTPRDGQASKLAGYRRGDGGRFEPWLPDPEGRLWSDVLGLFLVVRGPLLQAQTAEGRLLLTPEQSGATLRDAIAARERAEAEIEHLRQELARLRGERGQ